MRMFQALAFAAASAAVPAHAQDGRWSGQITPYVWASGIGGDLTPFSGAPTVSFDESFSDVLADLDAAFFVSGYARRDRLVLMADFSHSAVSKEGEVAPGIPAEGELKQTSLTLLAGYQAVANGKMTLDLLAGGRAWRIRSEVAVAGGAFRASPEADFVDPILALRANFAIAPRWSAIVYGDIGGFGAGSERTSQLFATVNYRVTENVHVSGGFRQLSVDYRDGEKRVDATMSGPLFGVTWRF